MRTLHSVPIARRGFTLLEILIVVAVMAMLAAAAIPVASKALSSAARKATREELVQVGAAAQEYFRDTNVAPQEILDLERDSSATGWAGPYLAGAMQDQLAVGSSYATDAWSRDYRLKLAGDVMTITSSGADAALDTDDDVRLQVDFTPIRREETLEELETINRAVMLYNGVHGVDAPLSSAWKSALTKLVDSGFLPDFDAYAEDAWGNLYVGDPVGKSPLVRVASSSVASPDPKKEGLGAKATSGSKKSSKKKG